MDLSPLIARLEAEARESRASSAGPPSFSSYWPALFDAIENLKKCGNDYDKARAFYTSIMRMTIDEWPNLNDTRPAQDALASAMEQWRKARNIDA